MQVPYGATGLAHALPPLFDDLARSMLISR